jgi:hypothetical protein
MTVFALSAERLTLLDLNVAPNAETQLKLDKLDAATVACRSRQTVRTAESPLFLETTAKTATKD